jgi:hypothetical protein
MIEPAMNSLADTAAVPTAKQRPLSGVELLIIGYRALGPVEQDDLLDALQSIRLEREAGEQTKTELMIGSLARVRELIGHAPTVTEYRQAIRKEMAGEIELNLEPLSRVIPHFGSWRMAREALELTEQHTPRRIEAMFRNRRVGRVHQYSEATLKDSLRACADALGHVPQCREYGRWREQEIELAQAQGNKTFQLPGVGPYRARWGTWPEVLKACGFAEVEIASRLERS